MTERTYTKEYLESLHTISSSQFDDLKLETFDMEAGEVVSGTRVWLSRMTIEDGQPYNNQVTIEKLKSGYIASSREAYEKRGKRGRWESPRWVTVYTYEAK